MRPWGYARGRREAWAAELAESERQRALTQRMRDVFERLRHRQLTKFDFPNEEIQ